MSHKILVITAVVLTALVILAGWQYFEAQSRMAQAEAALENLHSKYEPLNRFAKMFIKEVLRVDGEVSFEARLKLETAVRDLKNGRVLAGWQKFVGSQTEAEAQNAVKDLLNILVEEEGKLYEEKN